MQMISPAKKEFIEFMMSADVLRFGEFTTKSGRLSPYFVNTGNYKTGGRLQPSAVLRRLIMTTCGDNFDAMFGPAYKGIPLVTAAAAALATRLRRRQALLLQPQGGQGPRRRRLPSRLQAAGRRPHHHHRGRHHRRHRCARNRSGPAGRGQGEHPGYVHLGQPLRGRPDPRQNRRHGGQGSVRHPASTPSSPCADIHEYLKEKPEYASVLSLMEQYMDKYCIL